MTIATDTLDALRQKHGEVWTLERAGKDYVLRCPEAAEYRRFLVTVADDRKALFDAQERLARHAVVLPDAATLSALLERRPGLVPWLAGEAANIAADLEETEAKKA
jgi:hypothetical protein